MMIWRRITRLMRVADVLKARRTPTIDTWLLFGEAFLASRHYGPFFVGCEPCDVMAAFRYARRMPYGGVDWEHALRRLEVLRLAQAIDAERRGKRLISERGQVLLVQLRDALDRLCETPAGKQET